MARFAGDSRVIAFRCRCTHLLDAPATWAGQGARCPSCGATLTVPETSDPLARAAIEDGDRARLAALLARQQAGARGLADAPARTIRMRPAPRPPAARPLPSPTPTRPVPPPVVPPRAAFAEEPTRPASLRWIAASSAALVAVAAGVIVWKLSRPPAPANAADARPSAAESAAKAGPPRESTHTDRLVAAIDEYYRSGESLQAAETLAPLARRADEVTGNPLFRARTLNGAAWFLATTPHAKLRDPPAAIRLATLAVTLSERRDADYLDTLAEALFLGGRALEAIDVEVEALAKLSKTARYRPEFEQRLAKYRAASHATDAGRG